MKKQENEKIRLHKFLADAGIASRRKSEELIAQGAVKVNDVIAQIGDQVDPSSDQVTVKGKRVTFSRDKKLYIMLYKPRGFLTTVSDEYGRKCVTDLVKIEKSARIYPVGRLDKDSEGLLLMTNDGAFANAITHPSSHLPKTYRVTIRGSVTDDQLDSMSVGMLLDDGHKTLPADVRVLEKDERRTVLELVLYEGRNRQIRRMCEGLGLEIARLKRTHVGKLGLGMLAPGKWRELDRQEVEMLIKK